MTKRKQPVLRIPADWQGIIVPNSKKPVDAGPGKQARKNGHGWKVKFGPLNLEHDSQDPDSCSITVMESKFCHERRTALRYMARQLGKSHNYFAGADIKYGMPYPLTLDSEMVIAEFTDNIDPMNVPFLKTKIDEWAKSFNKSFAESLYGDFEK
jgi:hypothetical protein